MSTTPQVSPREIGYYDAASKVFVGTVNNDQAADAAYIYLVEGIDRRVATTYPCDPREVNGQIHLDFDARRLLPGGLLDGADPPGA